MADAPLTPAGEMGSNIEFYREVPANIQADVFANVLDRASRSKNYAVIRSIIIMLRSDEFSPPPSWNSHLIASLLAIKSDPDSDSRALLVDLLAERDPKKFRKDIISMTNDKDDKVRYKALDRISSWPDAASIYHDYIDANRDDPAFANAARNAQGHLQIIEKSH